MYIKSIKNKIYKGFLLSLMISSYILLTYKPNRGLWLSILGTILILLFARLCWSEGWYIKIGFKLKSAEVILATLLFILTAILSYIIINYVAIQNNISFKPYFVEFSTSINYLHTLSQTLNEELILGALLLFSLRSLLKKMPIIALSFVVAILFPVFHILFYSYFITSFNRGVLNIITTFPLLLVGIARNNFILCSNHIGYSWAIHLGWNTVFFGGRYVKVGGQLINEPERFNIFLGSQLVLVFSFIIVLITMYIYKRKIFKSSH